MSSLARGLHSKKGQLPTTLHHRDSMTLIHPSDERMEEQIENIHKHVEHTDWSQVLAEQRREENSEDRNGDEKEEGEEEGQQQPVADTRREDEMSERQSSGRTEGEKSVAAATDSESRRRVIAPPEMVSKKELCSAMGIDPPAKEELLDAVGLLTFFDELLTSSSHATKAADYINSSVQLQVRADDSVPQNEYQRRYVTACAAVEHGGGKPLKPSRSVLQMLERVPSLVEFDLSQNVVGNQGAIPVIRCLSGATHLTSLNLSGNCLQVEAIQELKATLKDLPSVTTVNLNNNNLLAAAAARELTEIVEQNPQLVMLQIEDTNVPVYSKQRLQRMLQAHLIQA
eukprot:NODE_796_length_1332_cov_321.987529_g604_i0.p1 GENE.NODE_796_length_1332_cov_321.987529_g604_i0~~NODE_796_length_1332_cov_321.987529_g604_i0.p1  ORF type:complete len:342 (-),score=74.07 NODE_796_length_1332_cov_321.987529_g604_i0:229-1254(-)